MELISEGAQLREGRQHVIVMVGMSIAGIVFIVCSVWLWFGAASLLRYEAKGEVDLTHVDETQQLGVREVTCASIASFEPSAIGGPGNDTYADDDGSTLIPGGAVGAEIARVCDGRRTLTVTQISSRRAAAGFLSALGLVLVAAGHAERRLSYTIAAEAYRTDRAIVNAVRE